MTSKKFIVSMPSQDLVIHAEVDYDQIATLSVEISYTHPTTGEYREATRRPSKESFSMTHFEKELDAYIVQEAMSDLTDNRHVHDWID